MSGTHIKMFIIWCVDKILRVALIDHGQPGHPPCQDVRTRRSLVYW